MLGLTVLPYKRGANSNRIFSFCLSERTVSPNICCRAQKRQSLYFYNDYLFIYLLYSFLHFFLYTWRIVMNENLSCLFLFYLLKLYQIFICSLMFLYTSSFITLIFVVSFSTCLQIYHFFLVIQILLLSKSFLNFHICLDYNLW